ncbi:MAG: hypothetical protein IPK01_14780 [Acidobacteria bacterium]|nr:hypothetical protein [Acidobacteriota bacterium]
MNELIKTNLTRLKELKGQTDQAQSDLQKAQEVFESLRRRSVNLLRFLEAEIEEDGDETAKAEVNKLFAGDRDSRNKEVYQSRINVSRRNEIVHSRPNRILAQEIRVTASEQNKDTLEAVDLAPTFNKTRFLVGLWAQENADGRGVNARSLMSLAAQHEEGKQISIPYVHNTISRFKHAGRAEQREDQFYYLTAAGLNYLEGGDA